VKRASAVVRSQIDKCFTLPSLYEQVKPEPLLGLYFVALRLPPRP
jgi:hypothetical protein